uniref:Bestrophin homolog n=1 Tax=Strongyloides stercoralis TaxID=6248 RepID=A0A0K0EBX7_STRER
MNIQQEQSIDPVIHNAIKNKFYLNMPVTLIGEIAHILTCQNKAINFFETLSVNFKDVLLLRNVTVLVDCLTFVSTLFCIEMLLMLFVFNDLISADDFVKGKIDIPFLVNLDDLCELSVDVFICTVSFLLVVLFEHSS